MISILNDGHVDLQHLRTACRISLSMKFTSDAMCPSISKVGYMIGHAVTSQKPTGYKHGSGNETGCRIALGASCRLSVCVEGSYCGKSTMASWVLCCSWEPKEQDDAVRRSLQVVNLRSYCTDTSITVIKVQSDLFIYWFPTGWTQD